MTSNKTLLILGGSMTTAWNQVEKEFFDSLGFTAKTVVWHANAWRFAANTSPFTLSNGVLEFNPVVNKSKYYNFGQKHVVMGSVAPIAIKEISGIVFTQPTTERLFIHRLFNKGYYIVPPGTKSSDQQHIPTSGTPISPDVLFEWWRTHQHHSERFMETISTHHPEIPIFLPPSILPRRDQKNLSKEFCESFLEISHALCKIMEERYGVFYSNQPRKTYDLETLRTKEEFAAPHPDPHHYRPSFAIKICETKGFRAFIKKCQ